MAVQHRTLPEAQLHEPKGVSTAPLNSLYVADGVGSGIWKKPTLDVIAGFTGDGGSSNLRLLTNGSGGIRAALDSAYGTMGISNNSSVLTFTSAADPNLISNADYIAVTGAGGPWAAENMSGVTFSIDKLVAPVAGVYKAETWIGIGGFPTETAKVGFKFRINTGAYSVRRALVRSTGAQAVGNASLFETFSLNAGDSVQLVAASSASGGYVFENIGFTLSLIKAT